MDLETSFYLKVNCGAHCFLSSAQLRLLRKRAWNTKRRRAIANSSGVVWGLYHLAEPRTHKPSRTKFADMWPGHSREKLVAAAAVQATQRSCSGITPS